MKVQNRRQQSNPDDDDPKNPMYKGSRGSIYEDDEPKLDDDAKFDVDDKATR